MTPTRAAHPTADQADVAAGLRLSVMRLARRMRQQRGDTGLTLSQLATLATLDRHGPLAPGELAAHERVSPPSMTRLVTALESEGLASRAPHPTDGRQVLVALSPAGRDLLVDDRRRRDAWLAQRLAGLEPGDVALLARAGALLDRLASE